MRSKLSRLKPFLVQLRSRYSPGNSLKISRKANFQSKANILNTRITIPANNTVRLAEGVRLRSLTISIKGENNELIMHEGSYAVGEIQLHGNNNRIEIGKRTRLTGVLLAVHHGTSLTIGERCMFATGIDIRTTDSHPIYNAAGDLINPHKDIVIADKVWLAKDVAVMKGSVIGRNTVVGFRSLVAGKLPANSVCAGMPAKVLKEGTSWWRSEQERAIELGLNG